MEASGSEKEWPSNFSLLFVDDLVLFAVTSLNQAVAIKYYPDLFCTYSEQKVSSDKTGVCFSKNVNHIRAREISAKLGFRITANLGKYSRVPLHHQRINKSTYSHILTKVQQRLSTWSSKSLDIAGQVTLSKAVLSCIPLYSMPTNHLSVGVGDSIDATIHNFIRGSSHQFTIEKSILFPLGRSVLQKRRGRFGTQIFKKNE